jgi:hypothetical protein
MAWCPDRHVPVDVCVGRKRSVGDGIGDDARALSSRRNAGVGAVFRLPRNSTMGRHVTAPWIETDSTRSSHPPPPTTTTCTHAGRFRWAREPHASAGRAVRSAVLCCTGQTTDYSTVLRSGIGATMDIAMGTTLECDHVTADRHTLVCPMSYCTRSRDRCCSRREGSDWMSVGNDENQELITPSRCDDRCSPSKIIIQ